MADKAVVVESPATEAEPVLDIAKMTAKERSEWRMTGKVPTRSKQAEATAASSEAAEESPAAETASESGTESQKEPQGKKRGAESRIRDLVEKNKALEARLKDIEGGSTTKREPEANAESKSSEKTQIQRPQRPKWSEFENRSTDYEVNAAAYEDALDKYHEDLADFKAQQRLEELQTRQQKAAQEAQLEAQNKAIRDAWAKKVEAAKQKYPDFEEVALNPDLPIRAGSVLDGFVLNSKYGTDVLHHLASNPDELAEIQAISNPYEQAEALMELGIQLSGKGSSRSVSKAPPPARVVGATGGAPDDRAVDAVSKGDFRLYMREMNQRAVRSRRG